MTNNFKNTKESGTMTYSIYFEFCPNCSNLSLLTPWRVVLRHDPRSKRMQGEREIHVFSAPGSTQPTLSTRSGNASAAGSSRAQHHNAEVEEVPFERFAAHVQREEPADDEAHYDDTQFVDEVEIQYVE